MTRADEVNPHMSGFVNEVRRMRIQRKARVYQTYVNDGDKKYAFVTTSKDLHLGLGEMTKEAQVLLTKLLEYEFARGNFGQLILGIQKDEGDECNYTLVAMSTYLGEISFGFSPTR
ncbi:MAG: hypothetical protein WC814_02760 [Candidatus Paceibacterota bacterium]|jgi:hypothetical protein